MINFQSGYSATELISRWDEYTSISRFAGSDETMDLVYISKRRGNRVKLVRKAQLSREPFSTVFRGRIKNSKNGSEIVGCFTKSLLDYLVIFIIMAALIYMRSIVIGRGGNPITINNLLAVFIVASLFCLYNFRSAKRKYAEFICRITGEENKHFLSKKEINQKSD